jgi:hypothetical protein
MNVFSLKYWLALLALCFVAVSPAYAQQQRWAAAYVDWLLPEGNSGSGVSQEIWVPQAARASFFTLNFDFVTGQGGYIGLQSDESGAGNVRFSLWNTTEARGEACRPFDGEGEGMTCVLPLTIDPEGVYRVQVSRDVSDGQGQWWVGWIETPDGARRQIGAIRTPRRHQEIASAGLHNFSEYWGDAVAACRDVPLSAAVFGAPSLAVGPDRIVAGGQPNGTRPEENVCASGRERLGAVVTHVPMTLQRAPAMALALGGAPEANLALARGVAGRPPVR